MTDFLNYLANLKISKKSLKNYKSDINHFYSWLVLKVRSFGSYIESLEQAGPFLSDNTAKDYRSYLQNNSIPLKTINRRLSTLRHFARYLKLNGTMSSDFMKGIENITAQKISKSISMLPLVDKFKAHLATEKVSDSTMKNYLSDVRQFLTWLENNPTHAQSN